MGFWTIYLGMYGGGEVAELPPPPILGVDALTQTIAWGPFTGRRYGSFAGKLQVTFPDFMHGTVSVTPYILGSVLVSPHLFGKLTTIPHLNGDIRTNP